jgi:hypothetical protein
MLQLEFSEADKRALNHEHSHHPHPRAQQRMEALWLKRQGLAHHPIAPLCAISGNTLPGTTKICVILRDKCCLLGLNLAKAEIVKGGSKDPHNFGNRCLRHLLIVGRYTYLEASGSPVLYHRALIDQVNLLGGREAFISAARFKAETLTEIFLYIR